MMPTLTNGGGLLLIGLLLIIAACIYLIATGRSDGRPHLERHSETRETRP